MTVTLNKPSRNSADWHTPLNENFGTIEDKLNSSERIYSPFLPHEQDPADLTIRVDSGPLWDRKSLTEVAAQDISPITQPSSNDRIDRVVMDDEDGSISVLTGTEDASPSAPSLPYGKLPIAQIYLTPGITEITNSDITDERAAIPGQRASAVNGLQIDEDTLLAGYGQQIAFKTANFSLSSNDMGKTLDCDKGTTLTITVPENGNVSLPVGFSVTLIRSGDGTVEVSGESGVSIRTKESLSISRKWGAATLYKRATNEWVIIGDIF